MSTVTEFNTQSVRPSNKPQSDTFAEVKFPWPFVAPPRLPHGIRLLDIDRGANIHVKSTIEDIKHDSAVYHITSWDNTTIYGGATNSLNLAPANLEILTGEHTRLRSLFFNRIDLDKSNNWRLKTTATRIDNKGFTLSIDTWSDTVLYSATACWIAYPEDRERIFSASASTTDIRHWNKPQHNHSKSLSFGDVKFLEKPDVFVALNTFDVGCQTNFRLCTYVDDVTTSGLTWHINSWHDTILYSAGITIIAVN
ncbi:hypothetical protein AX16_007500 [Volvariella volvacea WC 439]|nr:hypothetical protein AX16_007500 [Volvariella volvacea WC 439]